MSKARQVIMKNAEPQKIKESSSKEGPPASMATYDTITLLATQVKLNSPPKSAPSSWNKEANLLLNAMSGITYIASRAGLLLAIGERRWNEFSRENSGQHSDAQTLLGRNLFDFIKGESVKAIYQSSHATLIEDAKAKISFEYRCDAPHIERRMLMSISPIQHDGDETAILYQSQVLDERVRVPMMIYSSDNCRRSHNVEDHTSICDFCSKIAWPVGSAQINQDWISAAAYYRRGGSAQVRLSHGICPACFDRSNNAWKR